AAKLLADINAGKAQLRRPPQRLDRELGACIPAGGVRQPLLTGKLPRRLLKRPLFIRKLEIHRPNIAAARRAATAAADTPQSRGSTASRAGPLPESLRDAAVSAAPFGYRAEVRTHFF